MNKIYYEPDKVFDFCKSIRESGDERECIIAEEQYFDIEIYVAWAKNDVNPYVIIYIGNKIEDLLSLNESNCEKVIKKVYEMYLYDFNEDYYEGVQEDDEDDEEDECEKREDELYSAFDYFMSYVFEDSDYNFTTAKNEEEIISDCMNAALRYIAKRWGISIYRPVKIPDKDGVVEIQQYPYATK